MPEVSQFLETRLELGTVLLVIVCLARNDLKM